MLTFKTPMKINYNTFYPCKSKKNPRHFRINRIIITQQKSEYFENVNQVFFDFINLPARNIMLNPPSLLFSFSY